VQNTNIFCIQQAAKTCDDYRALNGSLNTDCRRHMEEETVPNHTAHEDPPICSKI
jgi:hypothetical protein